jgi:two-component system cell cycle response regulator
MAEEANGAKADSKIQKMLSDLKKRKGLQSQGFAGKEEVLQRIRAVEEADELATQEVHRAAAKGESVLEQLTVLDPITELYNHRTLVKELDSELKRALRYSYPVSVCMIAADNFAAILQEYGGLTADALLRVIANVVRGGVRETDIIGRYNEQRFVVVLPRTSAAGAGLSAERIRERIGNQAIMYNWQNFSVTASAGVATFPDHAETYDELLARAMEAMERAMEHGGDRVLSI